MRVRILTSIVGHADPAHKIPDFSYAPGDTPDLPKKLAEAWIASGIAESFKTPATEKPAEAANTTEPINEAV